MSVLHIKPQQIHIQGRLGIVMSVESWENGGAIEISIAGVTDRLVFDGGGGLLHIRQRVDAPREEA